MAAVVEGSHDEHGIIWPVSVAPYEVVITVVRADDDVTAAAAEGLYQELLGLGVETLLDDRVERPGVKFADAELIGIPYRITVGPRGVEAGTVELVERGSQEKSEVALETVASQLAEEVSGRRFGM